jgi:chloramphenicol-sensitive protein RarD
VASDASSGRARGVGAALFAAVCFASAFYLSGSVEGVPAMDIAAWRVLVALTVCGAALGVPAVRRDAFKAWRALFATPWKLVPLACSACLAGVQLWLFAWAPQNGHAMDVSLGFLLMPLTLVLVGRFFFADPVSRAQWFAVALAGVAVGSTFLFGAGASWPTFAICLGYPFYFIIRRWAGLDGPAAFGMEMVILSPVAIVLASSSARTVASPASFLPLVVIGLAGTLAMVAYLASARLLPLPLFGLLGYVEPLLLVVVSLLLGERLTTMDMVTYLPLVLSLIIVAVDGYSSARGKVDDGRASQHPARQTQGQIAQS